MNLRSINTSNLHPTLRNVSAVLFDAGGTLVHPDWTRLSRLAKSELNRDFSVLELRQAASKVLKLIDRDLQKNIDPSLRRANRLNWMFIETFLMLGVEELDCKRIGDRINIEHHRSHLWCVPDETVTQTLETLKHAGLKTGVVSNTEDGRLEESLRTVKLLEYFDFLIDSHKVGVRKPNPEIFWIALRKLKMESKKVAYIGDSYANDVIGAERAGMKAVLVDPLGAYEDLECTRIRNLGGLTQPQ